MKRLNLVYPVLVAFILIFTSCQKDALEGLGAEGPEGLGGEQGESGVSWNRTATADEVVSGIHLIITYNEQSKSFTGTLENLNTNVAQQTRLEAHVYDAAGNSQEFGPTTPVDMQPGAKRTVTLATPGVGNFTTFKVHAEVGAASAGGEGGNEGPEGSGN